MSAVRSLANAVIPRFLHPAARRAALRSGLMKLPAPQYPFRDQLDLIGTSRPQYLWGTLCAAFHAKHLGLPRISVIEFGVAGGKGLLELERLAGIVEGLSGVGIDVYGFDTGTGLPKPQDYRDLPQMWREGSFGMDVPQLKGRLTRAKLVLGLVKETVPRFLAEQPAPVGFVAFDLDLYTSTMDAFEIFRGDPGRTLPRVTCYFDDILGYSYGDFNGERLAISDFNASRADRKISQIYGLRHILGRDDWWIDMAFMLHCFEHPAATAFDGQLAFSELPLAR